MTRLQLQQQVISRTGRSDKAQDINHFLNWGMDRLSEIHPWDCLRPEINNPINELDTQFQIPEWVDQIIEMRLLVPASPTLSYPMELHRKTWFVKQFPNVVGSTITGRPLYCYRDENTIFLDRKSNGSYNILCTVYAIRHFLSDQDKPRIPRADEALIAYATARLYEAVQMYEDAQYWMAQFNNIARSLINQEERELGVRFVADEWTRKQPVQTNQPWLDPFEGHQDVQ